jgi:hypothetical protein
LFAKLRNISHFSMVQVADIAKFGSNGKPSRSVEMVAVNDSGRSVAISQTANSREADKEAVS